VPEVLIPWLVTGLVVGGAAVSAALYRHGGRRYAEGKGEPIPPARGFRWVYRYLQASTVLVAVGSQWSDHPAWLSVFRLDWLSAVGLVVSAVGLAVFVWAKRSLGRAYSPCFDSLVPQAVVSAGPYRWVRHPIYTGNLLILLGLFFASGSVWLAVNVLVTAVYYVRAAVAEERALGARFPEYAGLVARTGRFLPRLPPRPLGPEHSPK
jgi:protein-S-isoprenylcysteine O-methyltransferase Ste14